MAVTPHDPHVGPVPPVAASIACNGSRTVGDMAYTLASWAPHTAFQVANSYVVEIVGIVGSIFSLADNTLDSFCNCAPIHSGSAVDRGNCISSPAYTGTMAQTGSDETEFDVMQLCRVQKALYQRETYQTSWNGLHG